MPSNQHHHLQQQQHLQNLQQQQQQQQQHSISDVSNVSSGTSSTSNTPVSNINAAFSSSSSSLSNQAVNDLGYDTNNTATNTNSSNSSSSGVSSSISSSRSNSGGGGVIAAMTHLNLNKSPSMINSSDLVSFPPLTTHHANNTTSNAAASKKEMPGDVATAASASCGESGEHDELLLVGGNGAPLDPAIISISKSVDSIPDSPTIINSAHAAVVDPSESLANILSLAGGIANLGSSSSKEDVNCKFGCAVLF